MTDRGEIFQCGAAYQRFSQVGGWLGMHQVWPAGNDCCYTSPKLTQRLSRPHSLEKINEQVNNKRMNKNDKVEQMM